MKFSRFILMVLPGVAAVFFTGCRTDYGVGSPYHPGPAAGKAVGAGIGVVAGNAAGFGVGVAEGAVYGATAPFNPDYHMVRHWRTETTTDGRTIQVPYDVLVDKYGRPVNMPARREIPRTATATTRL